MINQYRYIVTLPYQLAHALILHHCFRSKLRGNALFLIIHALRQGRLDGSSECSSGYHALSPHAETGFSVVNRGMVRVFSYNCPREILCEPR